MRKQLQKIYELQEVDKEISARMKKLKEHPVLKEFEELKKAYQKGKTDLEAVEGDAKLAKKRTKKMEMDVQSITEQIHHLKGKLYSGEVTNTKELGQYEKKLQGEEKEKDEKEEELLTLMEEIEQGEKALTWLSDELKNKRRQLKDVQAKGQLELDQIKDEIEELNEKRKNLRHQINDEFLNKYDKEAKKKTRGFLVHKVNNNMCEGCRVFLSSSILNQLDNPEAIIECENCGRYLLRN